MKIKGRLEIAVANYAADYTIDDSKANVKTKVAYQFRKVLFRLYSFGRRWTIYPVVLRDDKLDSGYLVRVSSKLGIYSEVAQWWYFENLDDATKWCSLGGVRECHNYLLSQNPKK